MSLLKSKQLFKRLGLMVLLLLSAVLVLVGCDKKVKLSFEKNTYTVVQGETLELKPEVEGKNVELVYSSEDDKIATYVDGQVKGIAIGKTKVRVEVKDNKDIFAVVTVEVTKPSSYTITYHLDGGTNHKDNLTSFVGNEAVFLQPATKTGYVFGGWYTSSQFTGTPVALFLKGTTGNKELYARWIPIYNVTYELFGGTNDEENPETYLPTNPEVELKPAEKDGFEFLGWFDNAEFKGEAITKIASGSTGDKKLYAYFKEPVDFTITYELDGGTNGAKNPEGFNFLDLPIKLEDAVKRGYSFKGWFDNAEFKGEAIAQLTKEEDITLYAKFVIDEFTLVYNPGEGKNPEDAPAKYTVEDLLLELPIPTRDGSGFGGWYTNPEFDGLPLFELPKDFALKDLTLYAKWIAQNTFELKYELNGGINDEANPASFDNSKFVELKDPTREHYIFAGWYDNAKFAGEKLEKVVSGKYGAITLCAKWEAVQYEIDFQLDGGELAPLYANRAEVVADFLADFNAWGKTKYTLETLPMGAWSDLVIDDFLFDPVYRAKWTWLVSYFVTTTAGTEANGIIKDFFKYDTVDSYNAAGANHQYVLTWEVRAFLKGIQYTPSTWWPTPDYSKEAIGNGFWDFLPVTRTYIFDDATVLPRAVKEGFVFIGWFDNAEFTGSPVTAISAGNQGKKTIYAKYIENKTYEITYNLDGGQNNPDNPEKLDNAKVTRLLEPTKEGYHFLGWYSDVEFNNKITEIPAKLEEGFTVYAKWHQIETFNITYVLNGGINHKDNKVVYVNNVVNNILAPTKLGHEFAGWFTDPEFAGSKVSSLAFGHSGDLMLYAKWNIAQFNINFDANSGTWSYNDKAEMVADFMADFNAAFNMTIAATEFQAKTYGKNVFTIFTHPTYGAKWMWMRNYIIQVATDQGHASASNLKNNDDGTWRGSIDSFLNSTVRTAWPSSADFSKEPAANGFFEVAKLKSITIKYTYNVEYTVAMSAPKKLGFVFEGWFTGTDDKATELTTIEAGHIGDVKVYAKWSVDPAYVQTVIDKIDGLPLVEELKLSDKTTLDEALAAYNILDKAGKDLVTNADKLTELVTKYDEIINGLIEGAKTIEEVIAAEKGDAISTIGVVTAINGNNVTIQAGEHAIYLYLKDNANFADLLKIGNKVFVRGSKDEYNGLHQISGADLVLLISEGNELPAAKLVRDISKEEDLLKLQAQLISLMNMTVKTKPATITDKGYNVVLVDMAGKEITLRVDSEAVLGKAVRDKINAAVNKFAVNERININAAVLGWFNGAQIMITDASQLVKPALTDDFMAEEALKLVKLPEGGDVHADFVLPTTGIYGAKIAWSSDNNAILVDGAKATVTRKDGDVKVRLNYVLTVGTVKLKGHVDFVVVDKANVSETLLYSTGFENATDKASYATGEMTADGKKWSLTDALRANLDNDKKDGSWSIRGKSGGNATMLFGFTNVTKVTFKYGRYGTDADGLLSVEISKDGETWVQVMEPTAAPEQLEEVTLNIDYENQNLIDAAITKDSTVQFRFTFGGLSGKRTNLDEVKVYGLF